MEALIKDYLKGELDDSSIYLDKNLLKIRDEWLEDSKKLDTKLPFIHFIMRKYYKNHSVKSELWEELIVIEDAILAYENNWYDTHDLNYIGENIEEYREKIKKHKFLLPDPKASFSEYRFSEGILVRNNL